MRHRKVRTDDTASPISRKFNLTKRLRVTDPTQWIMRLTTSATARKTVAAGKLVQGVDGADAKSFNQNHAVQMKRQNAKGQDLSQIHTVSLKEARSQNESPQKSLLIRIRRGASLRDASTHFGGRIEDSPGPL